MMMVERRRRVVVVFLLVGLGAVCEFEGGGEAWLCCEGSCGWVEWWWEGMGFEENWGGWRDF